MVSLQSVGLLQILAGLLALVFLKPALDNRDTPGSTGYTVATVGVALWMFGLAGTKFTAEYPPWFLTINLVFLGVELAAAGWLLMSLEVTGRRRLMRQTAVVLGAGILVLQVFFWTNRFHSLMYETTVIEQAVRVEKSPFGSGLLVYGGGFLLHTVASYLCVLVGESVLVGEGIRSKGIRRKQLFVLSLVAVPVLAASIVSTWGLLDIPYNVTSVGYLLGVFVLSVSLFEGWFLYVVPVARKTATEEMNAAMVALDYRNHVVDANGKARDLFSPGPEYIGTPVEEFFKPVPDDVVSKIANDNKMDDDFTVRFNDKQRSFSVSTSLVGDSPKHGRIVLMYEITSQKRREDRLERLNTRLQITLEETETGIWEWNTETGEVTWDETVERLFGYGEGEFPGTVDGFVNRVLDEDLEELEQKVDRAVETGGEYRANYRVRLPGGEVRWIQSRGVINHDAGEPKRMLGVATDITDIKRRERELRRYKKFIERSSDEIMHVSETGEVLYESPVPERLLGYEPGGKVGDNIFEYIHPDDRADALEKFNEALNDPDMKTAETRLRVKDADNNYRWVEVTGSDQTDTDIGGVVLSLREITDQVEREQELRDTKQELEMSNKHLEEFASVASHELKEPLRTVSNYLELLRQENDDILDEEAREYVESSIDATERMREMIEGLLEYSRAGTKDLELEMADTEEVLDEAVRNLGVLLLEEDTEVTCGTMPSVYADRSMLCRLFRNLIKNSAEHSGHGSVEVHVGARELDGKYEFSVEDDGVGIPEDQQGAVFDMFEGADWQEGTGIGLALCRRIVDRHGGSIRVESTEGEGTTFYFTVPKKKHV